MKITFRDKVSIDFEDVKLGACFTLADKKTYPDSVFMKLPAVFTYEGSSCSYNCINLVNNALFSVYPHEQVFVRNVELVVDK